MKNQYSLFCGEEKLIPIDKLNKVGLTSGLIVIEKLELLRRELRFLLEGANIKVGTALGLMEAINGQMDRKDIIFVKQVSINDLIDGITTDARSHLIYTSTIHCFDSYTFVIDKNFQLIKKFSKPYTSNIVSKEIIRMVKG